MVPNKMEERKSLISKFNNLSSSAYKKMSELEVDRKYEITSAFIKETKFGKSIQVTLDDEINVFLPKRFSKLSKSDLKTLIDLHLIYKGKNEDGMDIVELSE